MGFSAEDLHYIDERIETHFRQSWMLGNVGRRILMWAAIILPLIGGAIYYVMTTEAAKVARSVAERTANNIDVQDVVRRLKSDEDFARAVMSEFDHAVLAFDSEDRCPDGWVDVGRSEEVRFAGRAIIVAGPEVSAQRRGGAGGTTVREQGDSGGEESVALTQDELAVHSHGLWMASLSAAGIAPAGSGSNVPYFEDGAGTVGAAAPSSDDGTAVTGSGDAHENMPPFIALKFCKKLPLDRDG